MRRRFGLLLVVALLGAALSIISTGAASASVKPACGGCGGGSGGGGDGGGSGGGGGGTPPPGGTLSVTGSCGDVMVMSVGHLGDPIALKITIPGNSSGVWSFTASQREFRAVTGAQFGDPFPLPRTTLPALTFNATANGFVTSGVTENLSGLTSEISYTATRTSPSPLTCTNTGFWTDPSVGPGPDPSNPTGRPGA